MGMINAKEYIKSKLAISGPVSFQDILRGEGVRRIELQIAVNELIHDGQLNVTCGDGDNGEDIISLSLKTGDDVKPPVPTKPDGPRAIEAQEYDVDAS